MAWIPNKPYKFLTHKPEKTKQHRAAHEVRQADKDDVVRKTLVHQFQPVKARDGERDDDEKDGQERDSPESRNRDRMHFPLSGHVEKTVVISDAEQKADQHHSQQEGGYKVHQDKDIRATHIESGIIGAGLTKENCATVRRDRPVSCL